MYPRREDIMASIRGKTPKGVLAATETKAKPRSSGAVTAKEGRPALTEQGFWSLLRRLAWEKTGDDEAVVEPVVAALSQMSVEGILRFSDMLSEKLHALDTEAHAREIGEYAYSGPGRGFSVDWFLYVRCCVVANGRNMYEAVLAQPKKMLKDKEFEAILYIAAQAYQRKTGKEFEHITPISYETFSNQRGWPPPAGSPR
jgi:hypothetical protein